ncbi:MAG: hypothetical protein U1E38_00735 [Rhodospirillales bacterium]
MVNEVLNLVRMVKDARNIIYTMKIKEFLSPISEVDENVRREFFDELEADEQQFRRFQVSIFTLVDTCDDIEKAAIMGRIMKAALQREISLDVSVRVCSMVSRSYVQDLYALKESPKNEIWRTIDQAGSLKETYITSNLESIGFISHAGIDGGEMSDNGSIMYQLNELGGLLIKYGLSEEPYCWNRFWTG